MAVDIAGYNNPDRTLAHLREVHEGLWSVLKGSFAETGVPWDVCFVENTGDGAMILLPPEVAKADLVAQLPERLHAELRRYNAVHSEAAQIQLRVALNAGEVQWGGQGAVGKAINATFRILDAPAAKAAQKATGADLALLASAMFYDDVVAQDPAAAPGEYARIPVSVKETSTIAWLRLLGASEARRVAAPEPAPDFTALIEALMDVPWVRNSDSRRLLLEMFPRKEIASQVSYHPQDRLHVIALARTCLRFEGGLKCLLDVVLTMDPHSPEVARLAELIVRWPEDR
ncbi:effector-associated domain 2-containing protein [Amycolatopsis sp. NPDC003865]